MNTDESLELSIPREVRLRLYPSSRKDEKTRAKISLGSSTWPPPFSLHSKLTKFRRSASPVHDADSPVSKDEVLSSIGSGEEVDLKERRMEGSVSRGR